MEKGESKGDIPSSTCQNLTRLFKEKFYTHINSDHINQPVIFDFYRENVLFVFLQPRTRFELVWDFSSKCGIYPAPFLKAAGFFAETAGIPQSRRVDAALYLYRLKLN